MDFETGSGTVTSISAFAKTREILTGDAFDFRPRATSIFQALLGTDLNQSQFLDVKSYSQELRFTSPQIGRWRWIAGAYYIHTDRFISTGNMVDTGAGVFPIYRSPRLTGLNPSATYLADAQDNDAWAVFADATFNVTDQFEIDTAVRYDEDTRENTTETPTAFLPDPAAFNGEVRKHTWSETQPKITLRYKPVDNVTFYGGWSRGFRSGGFNQTGVGAVADASGVAGVGDLFEAEVADTYELGVKGQFFERRLSAGLSVYPHGIGEQLLLRIPRRELHPEPRQPRREVQGRRSRVECQPDVELRRVRQLRLHRQQDHPDGRPIRHRQRSPARLTFHNEPRRPVPPTPPRRPGSHRTRQLPTHRADVVGALQHHLTRPHLAGRPAHRRRRRKLGTHRLVEEPHRREVQRGVFAWWVSVQGAAPTVWPRVRTIGFDRLRLSAESSVAGG